MTFSRRWPSSASRKAIFIGTSRGGLIAMLLGALRPGLMAGVVLNDIGPVLEGTGLARIKRNLDALHPASGWNEAIAALKHGIGAQFPALSMEDWRATAEAYFAQTAKGLVPQFDRNLLRAIADLDFSDRIPVLWPQFMSLARVPVLAIRGEFSDVLSADTLAEMAERHPDFEEMTVRGQGHAPLLRDMPSLNRILAFARRCEEFGEAEAARQNQFCQASSIHFRYGSEQPRSSPIGGNSSVGIGSPHRLATEARAARRSPPYPRS